MNTPGTVVVLLAAAWIGFSASSLLARKVFVVDNLAVCGVPRRWWPWLGTAKALGAVGLVAGLAVPAVGVPPFVTSSMLARHGGCSVCDSARSGSGSR